MDLLERVADSLTSIGDDPPTLLAFKSHAALPTDADWTESDALLKSYLLAAERQVDELSGSPYRSRSFTYSMEALGWYTRGKGYSHPDCIYYYRGSRAFKFPMRPVTGTPTLSWIDANGLAGVYTAGVDFTLFAPTSISPIAIFPRTFVAPCVTGVPYPYTLSFAAGGGTDAAVAQICIFEYAAAYYRSPEMSGEKLSYVSQVFDANMTFLSGSFL